MEENNRIIIKKQHLAMLFDMKFSYDSEEIVMTQRKDVVFTNPEELVSFEFDEEGDIIWGKECSARMALQKMYKEMWIVLNICLQEKSFDIVGVWEFDDRWIKKV
jgi:hypothetical protein